MSQSPVVEAPYEDHRVRVAREKREKMRAHLLRSVMAVMSSDQSAGPRVIDDVIRHAEVSRGTFYKYFGSLEQAVAELGAALVEEMTAGIDLLYDKVEDPRRRTATGFQLFLHRARTDRAWGGFVAHIGLLSPSNRMIRHMSADIQRGIDSGYYALPSVECGLDLLVGTKIEAILRIIRGDRGRDYIEAMTAAVLRGFGCPPAEAQEIALSESARVIALAPSQLEWWPAEEGR